MNTKHLMVASSFITGLIGVAASFLPEEILNKVGQGTSEFFILIIQIAGALYLGFAIMNWMAKTVLIGGIYARPLCMGNFLHFAIAAIVLIKAAIIWYRAFYKPSPKGLGSHVQGNIYVADSNIIALVKLIFNKKEFRSCLN